MWDVIICIILASFADCNDWEEIHEFVVANYKWLKSFLQMTGGIPKANSYERILSLVDDDFNKILFDFFKTLTKKLNPEIELRNFDGRINNGILRVNKTLTTKVKGKSYIITTPKTKNSVRTIELDDNLIFLLKKHEEYQKKLYGFNENWFIFGNIKFISETTLRRKLQEYLILAGIKSKNPDYKEGNSIITLHGFRHSHASLLIHLGLDSRDVAERLGDTIQMIEKTYYHMFPEKKSKTVNAINYLIKNSTYLVPKNIQA